MLPRDHGMLKGTGVLAVLGIVLLTGTGYGEEAVEARVQRALQDLNGEDYHKREAASAAIVELPAEAIPLLLAACGNPDAPAELRQRLPKALETLCARQARALARLRIEQQKTWFKKLLLDDYEKTGKKDPKWDGLAREALQLTVTLWSNDFKRERNEEPRIYALTAKALAAGCNDALVTYIHARSNEWVNGPPLQENLNNHIKSVNLMHASDYSEMLKTFCLLKGFRLVLYAPPIPEQAEIYNKQINDTYRLALEKLPVVLKDPLIPETWVEDMLKTTVALGMRETKDRKQALDAVLAALAKARPGSALIHSLRGGEYVSYAWDARGGGWASSVTEEGWKLMKERLAVAEEELNQAWALDPTSTAPAQRMIAVVLGTDGNRDKMELWFKRAMAANPWSVDTCEAKANFLEPKWHGSPEELLAFGRECFKTGDWDGDVPLTLPGVHMRLAQYTSKGYRFDPAYLKQPEVWKDIQETFEAGLKLRPKDAMLRSRYANCACLAEKWELADQLFKQLGDDAFKAIFGGVAKFKQMKAQAAKKAAGPDAAKTK